jgi:hypothetical protein
MPLDLPGLLGLLGAVDGKLHRKIVLVAAGGTAMTLLKLKPSTVDIDFTGPYADIKEFNSIQKSIPHGFKVDTWADGMVFSQILPADYLKKSIPIRTRLKKIELRALHPIDLVVTKIGRLNDRDVQDIELCVRKFGLRKSQVARRRAKVKYVGNEIAYEINLHNALGTFFTKERLHKGTGQLK